MISSLKHLIILVSFSFLGFKVLAQKDTVKLRQNIPIKHGFIILQKDTVSSYYISKAPGLIIFNSKYYSDSVFSISAGAVLNVNNNGSFITCTIGYRNLIYTYSNLKTCEMKKGSMLHRGDYIGRIAKDTDESFDNSLQLVVSKKGRFLNFKQHVALLQ